MNTTEFQEVVWEKARELYRDMPWRRDTQPYFVLVSEIMLQQTQVDRVIPKFNEFITTFPSVEVLAQAPLSEVLKLWSGLGYNRRAKFLHEAAKKVVHDFGGVFPENLEGLMSLPGVGVNTAGAILTYSFNQPVVFIETNVRTVYFHHYFDDAMTVTDKELRELVEQTVDREHPREWYWGIMDYGSYLKRQGAGRNDKSHHYKKQSALKGSVREVRGAILKILAIQVTMNERELRYATFDDERFEPALVGLLSDGLVVRTGKQLHLAE
jgi:A/G-specific adenine glycosylase